MTRWGMVVDVDRCVGCQTCTIACKMENGLPPATLWRTVSDVEGGEFPQVRRSFVPLTCMHCADPPCYDACPTTATGVREDGIVWIDNALCIGCGACVVACPYEARHLVPHDTYYFGEATAPERATYDTSRVGICTKCHFCLHKFDLAPQGVVPGVDPEYTPSCSSSCIAKAIVFGDLQDPDSNVSRLLAARGPGVQMLAHLETDPSVYYLNPRPVNPQPPRLQHSWHALAVANFFCGSTGIGLYLWGVLSAWWQGLPAPLLSLSDAAGLGLATLAVQYLTGLLGPLLVLIGLLSVALEAGRPWRGYNVFRHLGRSWMSRESGFAMGFIGLGWLDTLCVQSPLLQTLAVLTGLGVVLSQGLILSRAKGVPAWNVAVMPWHFVISALATGGGAMLVLTGVLGGLSAGAVWLTAVGLVVVLADLMVWYIYLGTRPTTQTFTQSVQVLQSYWKGIVLGGHIVPAVLLALTWLVPAMMPLLYVLAGVALLGGGVITKHVLITKAAFLVDLFEHFGPLAEQPRQVMSLCN
jgi:phenylacetyl-CoA:acceptor oxidoreductase subunit 1